MVFCLLLIAAAGIVAFFQYIQGFFSATISAILATIAAAVAMGWYEQAAPLLFNAKIYDQAASISMVVIFAVTYIVPRLLIDALVPGNVRVPFIVEKFGAGLMGLIAALMGTGIVAVAADALPFGPTVGMYARFNTTDEKEKTFSGQGGMMKDTADSDVLTGDKIADDDPTLSHVWLRQDDLVAGLIRKVSADSGSLANGNPFSMMHPDLIDELYAQRLGIQTGAKHSAVNTEKDQPVTVQGIYTPPRPIPQVDGEQVSMHLSGYQPPPATVTAEADQIVIIVRMVFSGKTLGDEADSLLRYSVSSIRLVAGQPDGGALFKDYFPVAVLDNRGTAIACRPDDFLISDISSTRTIDFVFVVDRDHAMSGDETKPPFHLPAGTFVEFKRYGLVDLSGKQVIFGPPPNPDKTPEIHRPPVEGILAKTDGLWTGASPVSESPTGGGSSPAASDQASAGDSGASQSGAADAGSDHPLGESGLGYVEIRTSNKLAVPISANTSNDEAAVQLDNGVGGELTQHQWAHLTVTMDMPVKTLGEPQSTVADELAVEPNSTLVQVECTAPVSGDLGSMWGWGKRLADFALADATGHTYPCVGAWATVQRSTEHYFVASYKNFDDKGHPQPIPVQKGRPVNVWLAFEVPTGTPIAEIRFSANTVMDNLNFKAQ